MSAERRIKNIAAGLAAVAAAVLVSSCAATPTAPTESAAYSQTDIVVGAGTPVVSGNSLTVDYTGWIYDASATDHKGPAFTTTLGATPLVFTLGSGQVIAGWDQGIVGMQPGGTRRLIVPPSLAYGSARQGPIPPYATLVFDITLDSAQ